MPDENATLWDVAVVGAGAAGLATAIFAARADPYLRIILLDGARKIGAKILVSGGGRCNVTNVRVDAEDFRGASRNAVRKVLRSFTATQAAEFFAELGVPLHEEEHGKLFPDSHNAHTVLDALLGEVTRRGVSVRCAHRVIAMDRLGDVFRLQTRYGEIAARRVVLATGGKSLPKTGSDGAGYELACALGHSIVEPVPALVPLVLAGDFHAGLSGVSHGVALTVRVQGDKPVTHTGSLLWTHFGVSGPVVLDASGLYTRARWEGRNVTMSLSFLPGYNPEQAQTWLLQRTARHPRETLRNTLATVLPARVADALIDYLRVEKDTSLSHVSRETRHVLIKTLLYFELSVIESRGFGHAEVTSGGVPLEEVDVSTMASRRTPGLVLVGEILNVDGRIGGYNFQWAWSTAAVAGRALGRRIPERQSISE